MRHSLEMTSGKSHGAGPKKSGVVLVSHREDCEIHAANMDCIMVGGTPRRGSRAGRGVEAGRGGEKGRGREINRGERPQAGSRRLQSKNWLLWDPIKEFWERAYEKGSGAKTTVTAELSVKKKGSQMVGDRRQPG